MEIWPQDYGNSLMSVQISYIRCEREDQGSKCPSRGSVCLIRPVSQIKRGSGICLDRTPVKCCVHIARQSRRKRLCCAKVVARPVMSASARWDACQCATGFGICSIKTRRFSRLACGPHTKCTSNGERFRLPELWLVSATSKAFHA